MRTSSYFSLLTPNPKAQLIELKDLTIPKEIVGCHRDFWGIYLISNEEGIENTLEFLSSVEKRGNTVVGVSGCFNFELYLAREPFGVNYMINIDPAPCYDPFWKMVSFLFQRTTNAKDFGRALLYEIQNNMPLYYSEKMASKLNIAQFSKQFQIYIGKALDTEEKFQKIQDLFTQERFLHFPLDLSCEKRVQRLREQLELQDKTIDTLYISNVETVLPTEKIETFRENVKALSDRGAPLVVSSHYFCTKPGRPPEYWTALKQDVTVL